MTTFAEMLAESLDHNNLRVGSMIRATVVAIGQDAVLVNAGLKSDAVIDLQEFKTHKGELEIKAGDAVDVIVEAIEDGFGATRLSREKAKRIEAWAELDKAYKNHDTIIGVIIERVKGGFTVAINNIRAFLPGSLVDVRPVRDPGHLEGKELEFKVIKMDQKRSNIVVSRRAVVEAESGAEREALLDKIEEGQEILGVVKNITDYGAFVDLGGIDGLLHITDMSWKRVKHPSEILNVGDEISVKVLKFDKDKKRVSLGLKQMGEDPWENIARRYPVNTRLFGNVTNLADYGCFVQLEEGIEGLVHMSEMDWTNKNIHPSKVVQLGDEVEVMVLDIDEDRRRISLGIKQCQMNPWEVYAQNHKKDEIIKGTIKSITDFGIFIGLDGGIDGLVHLSDISWSDLPEVAVREYSKGQEIEAIILAIDPERERISLGVKQLQPDPMFSFLEKNDRGARVSGKIIEIDNKRALVDLGNDVQGILRAGEISNERVNDVRDFLKIDDEIEVRVLGPDRKARLVSLSLKEPQAHSGSRDSHHEGSTPPPSATLGDILKEKMGGGKSD